MGNHLNIVKNDFFYLSSDTHFAVAGHSVQYDLCSQSVYNRQPTFHDQIANNCVVAANKMNLVFLALFCFFY